MADIYEMRAIIAKSLANPLRLKVLDYLLQQEECCVCDITKHFGVGQSTMSKHLGLLREAGVLASRKEGLMVYYWVKARCVENFFRCLDGVLAEELTEKTAVIFQGGNR